MNISLRAGRGGGWGGVGGGVAAGLGLCNIMFLSSLPSVKTAAKSSDDDIVSLDLPSFLCILNMLVLKTTPNVVAQSFPPQ